MEPGKPVRKRAVRLTPEGLELVKAALALAWQSDPAWGKLTREARADILGVSLATADRILKQQGVDRPTLTIAFKRLGLAWDDRYCESVTRPEVQSAESLTEPIGQAPARETKVSVRPLRHRGFALAFGLVIPLLLAPFTEIKPATTGPFLQSDFFVHLRSAEEAYHHGRYGVAKNHLDQVLALLGDNPRAPQLALALRLAGDLASVEGRYQEAGDYYRDSLVIRRRTEHSSPVIPPLLEAIGDTELKLRNFETARGYFIECLNGYRKVEDVGGQAMALRGLGSAEAGLGNAQAAMHWLEEGLDVIAGTDSHGMRADIQSRMALVLRDEGRLAEAKRLLTRCLDFWQSEGHPRWIAKTRYELGTVEFMAGRANVALMMLAQSRTDYQAMGDAGGVEACKTWLDKIGDAGDFVHQDLAVHVDDKPNLPNGSPLRPR
jgi:tetratricopeptide (TPR) repeat protein